MVWALIVSDHTLIMADKRREKIDISDEELDALAEISPSDVEDARRAWRNDASPAFKDLLDAAPDQPDPGGLI